MGYLLLLSGVIVCAASFDYQSNIMALIGTSTLFWGALLFYFHSDDYILNAVGSTTLIQYYGLLRETISGFAREPRPEYYTPANISGLSTTKIIFPEGAKPQSGDVSGQTGGKLDWSITIAPPGQKLSEVIEESNRMSFSSMDPLNLSIPLEKAIVEDLELAKSLNILYQATSIVVTSGKSIYSSLYDRGEFKAVLDSVGDPLISAIACAYSRSTRRNIRLVKAIYDEKRETLEYRLDIEQFNGGNDQIKQLVEEM